MFNRRAVFLDRDGTVVESIHRPDFVKKVTAPFHEEELKFVPNAYLSLSQLKEAGFLRILVTNQPDVAHGYMDEEVWRRIHRKIVDTLGPDDVFMCRHVKTGNCPFKKPSPMMILAAADKWGIDLSLSWMVGDTNQDMEAGRAAGCRTILIDRPYNSSLTDDDYHYRVFSLIQAVELIINKSKQL